MLNPTAPKLIEFMGSSLDDLRMFPVSAWSEAGHQLDQVQSGKISLFGLDALVKMAASAGLHVEM